MMRVYISGAITGTDDYIERFSEAEKQINAGESTAVNPAGIMSSMPKDTTHDQYMKMSLALLETCESMYVLKNWRNSKGVAIELEYAREHGIPVFFEEDNEPFYSIEQIKKYVCKSICPLNKSKQCELCRLNKETDNLKSLVNNICSELETYKAAGISPDALKTINDTYREMAHALSKAEKKIEQIKEIVRTM